MYTKFIIFFCTKLWCSLKNVFFLYELLIWFILPLELETIDTSVFSYTGLFHNGNPHVILPRSIKKFRVAKTLLGRISLNCSVSHLWHESTTLNIDASTLRFQLNTTKKERKPSTSKSNSNWKIHTHSHTLKNENQNQNLTSKFPILFFSFLLEIVHGFVLCCYSQISCMSVFIFVFVFVFTITHNPIQSNLSQTRRFIQFWRGKTKNQKAFQITPKIQKIQKIQSHNQNHNQNQSERQTDYYWLCIVYELYLYL